MLINILFKSKLVFQMIIIVTIAQALQGILEKNKNVKDLNHDSLGKSLKPLPQSGNSRHLENRHKEDKDIMKSPRIPHEHRNIESASKPLRENSFDAQSKVTGEGKIYRIILYLINSK